MVEVTSSKLVERVCKKSLRVRKKMLMKISELNIFKLFGRYYHRWQNIRENTHINSHLVFVEKNVLTTADICLCFTQPITV